MTAPDRPITSYLLDVRPMAAFLAGHHPNAANIPLEALPARLYELPPPGVRLAITDASPDRIRLAADRLRDRYDVVMQPLDPAAATATGPQRIQLWQPSPFLIEAVERLRAMCPTAPRPLAGDAAAPQRPRAVDVACGSGREAVWLAVQGWQVDAIDRLPDALAMADALAERCGVGAFVRTRCEDAEAGEQPRSAAARLEPMGLEPMAYDLVMVFRYLHRPLLPVLAQAVKPGGWLIYETFHQRTAAAGLKPRSPAHLLADGELPAAFPQLEAVIARDAVERDGRWFSQFLGRR